MEISTGKKMSCKYGGDMTQGATLSKDQKMAEKPGHCLTQKMQLPAF
jgi:hypothetical protein